MTPCSDSVMLSTIVGVAAVFWAKLDGLWCSSGMAGVS